MGKVVVLEVLQTWAVGLLMLGAASVIVGFLHGIRPGWRSRLSLALASVAAGSLVVGAKFEPVQHAVFPIRYAAAGVFMGTQTWEPHDAPAWLVALAQRGRIEREMSSEEKHDLLGSLPPGTVLQSNSIEGPARLPDVAYFDPSFVCGLPGAEARDPSSTPGVHAYRGVWALLVDAYGNSEWNAVMRGSLLLFGFGMASAVFFACLRRLHPSRRVRAALVQVDRAGVLCRAAWLSALWPAVAVLAHAFFYDLMVSTIPSWGRTLPLALGRGGVAGIWLGAGLAGALTLHTVALRAASKEGALAQPGEASGDAPTHLHPDPQTRRRVCATELVGDAGGSNRWRCGLVNGGLWLVVVLLLCAPLTLSLAGAVVPNWMLPVRSPEIRVQAQ